MKVACTTSISGNNGMSDKTRSEPMADAVGPPLHAPVVPPQPERFCIGVRGREQCDDCGGRYVPDQGFPVPLRILAHQPWPLEPCPHYVQPV